MGHAIAVTLSWLSAAAAVIAALLWWASARVKLPDRMTVGYGGIGGTQDELLASLKRQSRLSAQAAIAAGLSALAQAVAFAIGFLHETAV